MSGRAWFPNASFTSNGLVFLAFSFATNNTSDPLVSTFRGCGGLSGADTSGAGVSNSGPSAVATIVRKGVGEFEVALADGYRYVLFAQACIDYTAGSPDGYDARCAAPANEGSGRTTAVTMRVQVLDAALAAKETTGRRVRVLMVLKNTVSGA